MQLKCNMNSLSAASQVVSLKWVLQEAYAAWLFGNCAGRKPPASALAAEVARGVSRLLLTEGCSPILEFTLPNGRRLDVAALGPGGEMLGVEIKVALADLRGDAKWPEYLDYCDLFYFAIPPDFPPEHVPHQTGLIVADRYGGSSVKQAEAQSLH